MDEARGFNVGVGGDDDGVGLDVDVAAAEVGGRRS
jgi:hypothetical protein